MNIADLLTRQALATPHADAIVHGDRTYSYQAFEAMVWGLCRHLRDSGLGDGDVVGLHLHDPLLLMAAVFALARTGMVAVTVATDAATAATAEGLLERTAACAVVDDGAGRHWGQRACVRLDPASAPGLHGEPDDSLRVDRPGALLMYSNSSGTTGVPKVFGVTHESAIASLRAEIESIGYPTGERYLTAVSPSYAGPRRRYLCCLAAGGTAVMPPPGAGLAALAETIDRHDVRHFSCVPAQAYEMARAVPAGTGPRFPRMRCLRLSAGPSEASLHRFVRERLTPNLLVSYGCNELGPLTVAPPDLLARHPESVGRPIPGVSVEVVDAGGRAMPPGQVGQIRLRAPGMPAAYLDDEQTSAKSFRHGWFYPGDLGRWTDDGLLCHMGRADDMMILNGINIYPAEIEQAMLSHPAVAEAVAFPLKHPVANDLPVCAVALKGGERVSEEDLLSYARGRLGSHRPHWVAVMDAIPRNEQGKVQRPALAQAVAASMAGRRPARPAGTGEAPNAEPGVPRQLALFATVSFRLPPDPDFERLDAWLSGVLGLDVPHRPELPEAAASPQRRHEPPAIAWLQRVLLLSRWLLQAARMPVFDAPRIIACGPEPGRSDAWQARVAFARVEEVPNTVYGIAFKEAMQLGAWALAHPADAGNLQAFYAMAEQRVTSRLGPLLMQGKSTLPVLRAAHRKSIPFTHLGGGVFQLGWGSKAQRIDRSVTGRDSAIGARLCTDKALTAALLRKAGLPAPVHRVVRGLPQALKAAQEIGWPVVVKPADRERGEGVVVDVCSDGQLQAAFESARGLSRTKAVIVERQVEGVCHRLFMAHGRLLYAVKRLPMSVEGDGVTDIAGLVEAELARQLRLPPWDRSGIQALDDEARAAIARAGHAETSVPPEGTLVPLRRIESTAAGGIDEEVTQRIHPENLRVALAASELFGLGIAGVDIISADIARPWHENGAIVNEVNFAPLLGGGEISRRHIPAFLDDFVDGTGTIPVEVFVGGDAAWAAAERRWQAMVAAGLDAYLSDARRTLLPSGREWPMPLPGLYQRARALVLCSRVQAVVLVVQSVEFLATGLPLEAVDELAVVDRQLAGWPAPGAAASRDSADALLQMLRHWQRPAAPPRPA